VTIHSITEDLPVLTQDFEDLHDLVITAAGHGPAILIVRFDNDPRHNPTDRGIATAIGKLNSSSVPVRDRTHVMNQRRLVFDPACQQDHGLSHGASIHEHRAGTGEPDQKVQWGWYGYPGLPSESIDGPNDRLMTKAERHATLGRSLVSGRTVHANLNGYRTVNSRFRAVFGLGVFTKNRR
jgi:hypothetical protein